MEEHRLTPMKEGFDQDVFLKLYKNTEALKRKLANQIECRRLGVEYKDILSWFDVKFIFIFNKYCDRYNEDVLKGHIISGFQFFKQRILKSIYSQKNHVNDTIDIDLLYDLEEQVQEVEEEYNPEMDLILEFMRDNLSEEAYQVFKIDLNPPPYILNNLGRFPKASINKIPVELILEFFDIPITKDSIRIINAYRRDISNMTLEARDYFIENPISI